MSNLLEKKPILSDAEPAITEEPVAPEKSVDNGTIKVSLEVICCPCPKAEECDCKCKDCNNDDCKCADTCSCEKKEEEGGSCCQRWFPMFSRTGP